VHTRPCYSSICKCCWGEQTLEKAWKTVARDIWTSKQMNSEQNFTSQAISQSGSIHVHAET
jgi:hypothetical protein